MAMATRMTKKAAIEYTGVKRTAPSIEVVKTTSRATLAGWDLRPGWSPQRKPLHFPDSDEEEENGKREGGREGHQRNWVRDKRERRSIRDEVWESSTWKTESASV